ncbi:MAG: histidine--tRNA ligase [Chloracidobacterium sp.]|uniref:Histidine--tRNA ligase n=1 Tax=Chloracidobacterium validum TaxID=2821543 RepID=A0ABX8BBA3_9BACT|nr:histidine--tRNA ligase [Chloracidobacterium validum]QUW02939.1 histidine--tRNA ligase [Chloracidobacterium validum]
MIRTAAYTRDLLPASLSNDADASAFIHRFQLVERIAQDWFRRYGFQEIRTPIFERTELFARGVGAETDIVTKEMYTWRDRAGDDREGESLTLRPESTAPVARAYIQHQMWKHVETARLYYIGPQFRRERGQRGRYRQFFQIGAEVLGSSDHPAVDVEGIELVMGVLAEAGVPDLELRLNTVGNAASRAAFVAAIRAALANHLDALSEDSRRRYETNPLRILDSKAEQDQPLIAALPPIQDFLDDECRTHFDTVRRYLDAADIPYVVDARLVRGLDYYTKTVFEIVSHAPSIGSQNALAGGGRYDGLVETLGGPPTRGFGFALGLDRVVLTLPADRVPEDRPALFVIHLGEVAFERALGLVREARRAGLSALLDPTPRSLKSALRLANKLGARFALILGDTELTSGQWVLRDLARAEQTTVPADTWLHHVQTLRG